MRSSLKALKKIVVDADKEFKAKLEKQVMIDSKFYKCTVMASTKPPYYVDCLEKLLMFFKSNFFHICSTLNVILTLVHMHSCALTGPLFVHKFIAHAEAILTMCS